MTRRFTDGFRQPKRGQWQLEWVNFCSPLPGAPHFRIPWKWLGLAALFVVLGYLLPFHWAAMYFLPMFGMTDLIRVGGFKGDHEHADDMYDGGIKINEFAANTTSLLSRTINAGAKRFESGATNEARIALADAACVAELASQLYIPAFMLPYDISLCPASASVQRIREGGGSDVYDIRAYGAAGAPGRDDTLSVNTVLAALASLTGLAVRGVMTIPPGTYYCPGQLVVPNDGASPPRQANIKIIGSGSHFSVNEQGGAAPTSGSILDLRSTTGPAKFDTRGGGLLEITGVTFAALGGSDSNPFIQTTNTTLHVHSCSFYGSKSNGACDQDAIVLGGTSTAEDGTSNAAFQGYGTVIERNFFNHIRRGVYGRVYCNGVVVRDNTWWSACGSNLVGGAAMELDGTGSGQQCTGNLFTGNLVEMVHYPYAVKLTTCLQNSIIANNLFDTTGVCLAGVRYEADAVYNLQIDGYMPGSLPSMSEATADTNTLFAIDQQKPSQFGTGGTVRLISPDVINVGGAAGKYAHYKVTSGASINNEVYQTLEGAAATPDMKWWISIAGAAATLWANLHYYGAGQSSFQIRGATFTALENPDGDMKLRVKTGSTLWFGDMTDSTSLYYQPSTKTLVLNNAATRFAFGSSSGPTFTFGSAVPSVADPDGSLYIRSGSPNGSLYVRQNGAWVLK